MHACRTGDSRCSSRVRTMADYILNQRPEHVNRTKPQLKAVFAQVPHLDPYAVIPTLNLLQVARVRSPPSANHYHVSFPPPLSGCGLTEYLLGLRFGRCRLDRVVVWAQRLRQDLRLAGRGCYHEVWPSFLPSFLALCIVRACVLCRLHLNAAPIPS